MELLVFTTPQERDEYIKAAEGAVGPIPCPICQGIAKRYLDGQEVPIPLPCEYCASREPVIRDDVEVAPHPACTPGHCRAVLPSFYPIDHPAGDLYAVTITSELEEVLEKLPQTGNRAEMTEDWYGMPVPAEVIPEVVETIPAESDTLKAVTLEAEAKGEAEVTAEVQVEPVEEPLPLPPKVPSDVVKG